VAEGFGPGQSGGMRKGYSVIEGLNWYSYVSNNPIRYVAPTGKWELSLGGGAGVAGIVELEGGNDRLKANLSIGFGEGSFAIFDFSTPDES